MKLVISIVVQLYLNSGKIGGECSPPITPPQEDVCNANVRADRCTAICFSLWRLAAGARTGNEWLAVEPLDKAETACKC